LVYAGKKKVRYFLNTPRIHPLPHMSSWRSA
jgi:hypothetical protein